MDIQRTGTNRPASAPSAAAPAQTAADQASGTEAASKAKTPQEARPASADSYQSARAPEGAASRAADPAAQAISMKEQRRANRSAQAQHPILEQAGRALGLAAGVVVTEALALLPSWSQSLKDPNGKPVEHIPGADRIGDHDLEKRHQEVVGPQITALNEKIPGGPLHDLVGGFGAGATEAPGASYRLEVQVEDSLRGLWKKLTGGQ